MDSAFLDFDAWDPQLEAMLKSAQDFIAAMHANRPPYWLSFLGTNGAGKSMLTEAIIRWARRHQEMKLDPRYNPSQIVKYRGVGLLKWSRCCAWMMEGNYGWMHEAKTNFILAIDDIGVEYEKIRALAASKLYEVLEERRGLWTVVTANLSVEEIARKLDPRIASRLFRDGSEIHFVTVEDYNVRQFKLTHSAQ